MIFTEQYRTEIRQQLLEKAQSDSRLVSGALIGSAASGREDRWSDIDLTFGFDENYSLKNILEDWTDYVTKNYEGYHLVDVWRDSTIYRVFLLPGCLQLDLSFSPSSQFGATGPDFKLLFGSQAEKKPVLSQAPKEIFGWAIHHLLRARFCIARGRKWQAEYWFSSARDYALAIACHTNGLNISYGRGFDDLPAKVHVLFLNSFPAKFTTKELLRCTQVVISGLFTIASGHEELASLVPAVSDRIKDIQDDEGIWE